MALGLALGQAGLSFLGGALSQNQYDDQAMAQQRALKENIALMREENAYFRSNQEFSFLNSGIDVEGSPLLFLQDQERKMRQDVARYERSGQSQINQIRNKGRNAFLGGVFGAASSVLGGFSDPSDK